MTILNCALICLGAFFGMEGVAWFTHKYIMHGLLWKLHADHHLKEHDSFFERNDFFFLLFAVPGISLMLWGATESFADFRFWIGTGIALYGFCYFFVHDLFIHQRFPVLKKTDSSYLRGLRKAHKIHHKHLGKMDGECFGMLWVPRKYFIEARKSSQRK